MPFTRERRQKTAAKKLPTKNGQEQNTAREKKMLNRQRAITTQSIVNSEQVLSWNERIVNSLQFPNLSTNIATYSLPFDTSHSLAVICTLVYVFFFFLRCFIGCLTFFHLLFHNVVIILTSSNYNLLIFVLTHFARNP